VLVLLVFESDILDWAENYDVNYYIDPCFLLSIARKESSLYSDALSKAGAQGLMQFMPITVKDLCERFKFCFDPFDPKKSVQASKIYIKWLYQRFPENIYAPLLFWMNDKTIHTIDDLVLAAWNWGVGNVIRWCYGSSVKRIAEVFNGNFKLVELRKYNTMPDETKRFVSTVNKYWNGYKKE
jgi:soluble lytic murein transglycosylase-like protein